MQSLHRVYQALLTTPEPANQSLPTLDESTLDIDLEWLTTAKSAGRGTNPLGLSGSQLNCSHVNLISQIPDPKENPCMVVKLLPGQSLGEEIRKVLIGTNLG